jgi:AcrR family transcriptional regulator
MPTSVDAGRRGPRRDAVVNREALLAAAAASLAESADASLDAIARAAGLSRRSVYGHFANRDELVLALVDAGAERLNATAAAVEHDDAAVAIALLGARLWDAVEHVRLLAAMAVREPYVHRVATALEPVRVRLRELVARGAAQGVVRRDIPADVLAHLIERSALAVLGEATAPRAIAEGSATTEARAAATHASTPEATAPGVPDAPGAGDLAGAADVPGAGGVAGAARPAHAAGAASAPPSPADARDAALDARRLVMLAVLGTAGLSWREAGTLIDATAALAPGAPAASAASAAQAAPTAPTVPSPAAAPAAPTAATALVDKEPRA